jgi:hypothetical protein
VNSTNQKQTGETNVPSARSAERRRPDPDPQTAWALALQRQAGNAAVAQLLSRPPIAVQRHNSYEHMLMGDTRARDIASIASSMKGKAHAVEEEYQRLMFFQRDVDADPRDRFPDVRWLLLAGSKLWLSSGEVAALADYLPNPSIIDSSPRSLILPVLQRLRQDIVVSLGPMVTSHVPEKIEEQDLVRDDNKAFDQSEHFVGAAPTPDLIRALGKKAPASLKSIEAIDAATSSLGPNRVKGMLARNACHFAPFSWERWALHHNEARHEAAAHFGEAHGTMGSGGGMRTHERLAWVNNGYSNHFLQDSFAAGHLVNKTLVMQWFLEYNAQLPLDKYGGQELGIPTRPNFGLPRDEVAEHMTTAAQPGIAGRDLYTKARLHTSISEDRARGTSVADQQTTEERTSGLGRFAGSGVRDWGRGRALAYAEYSEFLNTTYVNLAANAAHDYFNTVGLTVSNQRGERLKIGGDATLLLQSDPAGLEAPFEANQLSDRAITELLTAGATSITTEDIFAYFPNQVEVQGQFVPLEKWNDGELKQLCFDVIFPQMESYVIPRAQSPRLIESDKVMDLPVRQGA